MKNNKYKEPYLLSDELVESIKMFVETVINNYQPVLEELRDKLKKLKDTYSDPIYIDNLIASYEKWGELGWTLHPYAEITVFHNPPENKNSADRKMLRLFKHNQLDGLVKEIKQEGLSERDLIEALDDFKAGRYKSCVLVLFSLIDWLVINGQSIDKSLKTERKTASSIVKTLNNQLINDDKSKLFTYLKSVNIVKALDEMFKYGKDFQTQYPIINRNFVSHGMLKRKVNKKDCFQVCLLLYNMVDLISEMKV